VEIVRDPSLRLNGYPTLRIERRGAPPLRVHDQQRFPVWITCPTTGTSSFTAPIF
jgi:hypothetical protein